MNHYKPILKKYLTDFTLNLRDKLNITQKQMSELLHITPRAYHYLESGTNSFSASSLMLLLSLLSDEERRAFFRDFQKVLREEAESKNA